MILNELKKSIENLTAAIEQKYRENAFDEIFTLMDKRLPLITQLTGLHPVLISRQELREFLSALRARDQAMIKEICRQKMELKGSLSNFNNVREYLVF